MEIDIVATSDGELICAHDFESRRHIHIPNQAFSNLNSAQIANEPTILHNVTERDLSPRYVIVGTPLCTLAAAVAALPEDGTMLVDARQTDSPLAVKWAATNRATDKLIIQIYHYNFPNAATFCSAVDALNPPENWRSEVALAPILLPGSLHALKPTNGPAVPSDAAGNKAFLLQNGKAFIDEYMRSGVRVFCFQIAVTLLGKRVNNDGHFIDPLGDVVTDPREKNLYIGDQVGIELIEYVRQTYPRVAICGVNRPQDFKIKDTRYFHNIRTGEGVAWPTDGERFFHEAKAKPTALLDIKFDLIITGRLEEELEILLHQRAGIELPRNYHVGTAAFQTRMGESTESGSTSLSREDVMSVYEMASL